MKLKFIPLHFVLISFVFFVSCENKVKHDNIGEAKKNMKKVSKKEEISFSRDIQPLFDQDCCQCHIDLNRENSYKMLTTKRSNCKVVSNYIDTIYPTYSYLYMKLSIAPPKGQSMIGVHWTPENIKMLLLWIEQGAKNN